MSAFMQDPAFAVDFGDVGDAAFEWRFKQPLELARAAQREDIVCSFADPSMNAPVRCVIGFGSSKHFEPVYGSIVITPRAVPKDVERAEKWLAVALEWLRKNYVPRNPA